MLIEHLGPVLTNRVKKGSYRPRASYSGMCPRQLTYRALGVPETNPTPARIGMVFAHGEAMEQALVELFGSTPAQLHSYQRRIEIPYKYGVITGHVDYLLGGTHVVDFKSINTYGFDEVLESGPLREHLVQVSMYLHGLQLAGEPYTDGLLVYVNKNDGRIAECTFSLNRTEGTTVSMLEDGTISAPRPYTHPDPSELIEEGLRTFEVVEEHVQENLKRGLNPLLATDCELTLPGRPYTYSESAPCSYCSWRDRCWEFDRSRETDGQADLSGAEEVVRRYLDLLRRQKQIERELDVIRGVLRALLVDSGASRGVCSIGLVELVPTTRSEVDISRIPDHIAKNAVKKRVSTELQVRVFGKNGV